MTLTSVREPRVPLIVTLLWLKHLVTIVICCRRHTCDFFFIKTFFSDQHQEMINVFTIEEKNRKKTWLSIVAQILMASPGT